MKWARLRHFFVKMPGSCEGVAVCQLRIGNADDLLQSMVEAKNTAFVFNVSRFDFAKKSVDFCSAPWPVESSHGSERSLLDERQEQWCWGVLPIFLLHFDLLQQSSHLESMKPFVIYCLHQRV